MSGTFELQDTNAQAVPISLYAFQRGSIRYTYSGTDEDIDYDCGAGFGVETYTATPVTDSGVSQTGEQTDDDVSVSIPWSNTVVQLFAGTAPSDEIFLTIMRMDFGDDVADVVWSGTITEVKRTDPATAEITCQTISVSFQRSGLTLSYSRNCPYFLGDPTTCGVNMASFATQTLVTALTETTVTAAGFAANGDLWYDGGYLEWPIGGTDDTFERRAIGQQLGNVATILGLTDGLQVGTTITIYPGCGRSAETCDTKFSNLPNCGCCNKMPGVSPFSNVNFF